MITKYNKILKQVVAQEICENGNSTSKVAAEYGIPLKTVEKWVTAYNKDNTVFDESELSDKQRIKELEAQVSRLKKDNDILKKTLRIFIKKE